MDHTPTQPAGDDRPLRLLERAPVPPEHKDRLVRAVQAGQRAAAAAGDELQAEFGKEHVALIVGCNQFVRLFRAGAEPGAVELLLPEDGKRALSDAGFRLRDPEGQVFRLFGWVRVDPMQGPAEALEGAVASAFARAKASSSQPGRRR